jgi:hypothetical protein
VTITKGNDHLTMSSRLSDRQLDSNPFATIQCGTEKPVGRFGMEMETRKDQSYTSEGRTNAEDSIRVQGEINVPRKIFSQIDGAHRHGLGNARARTRDRQGKKALNCSTMLVMESVEPCLFR